MPASILPEGVYEEGQDVTELTETKKYEKPVPIQMRGLVEGYFPTHLVHKTDEENLQSNPRLLSQMQNENVYVTIKLDGTSATYISHFEASFKVENTRLLEIRSSEISNKKYICSRNIVYKEDQDILYVNIYKKYKIDHILDGYTNIAIQGEIVGPGIQKNTLGLSEHKFFVFNIWNIQEKRYYDLYELQAFCQENNLEMVPIWNKFKISEEHTLDFFKEMCKGTNMFNGGQREGIVVRPTKSQLINGKMLSFKVLNPLYLLKEDQKWKNTVQKTTQ